jgi:hypothetical protein
MGLNFKLTKINTYYLTYLGQHEMKRNQTTK